MRIAILDDYQGVALSCADGDSLPSRPEITVFTEHIARHEALAAALRPFEVIVAMRERTAFGAGLLVPAAGPAPAGDGRDGQRGRRRGRAGARWADQGQKAFIVFQPV